MLFFAKKLPVKKEVIQKQKIKEVDLYKMFKTDKFLKDFKKLFTFTQLLYYNLYIKYI